MSKFLSGRVSVTTFVPAITPPDITEFRKMLRRHGFRPLDPTDQRDESAGWVDPFLSFEAKEFANCYFRDYYLFSLRIDRYQFSAAQLRPLLEELTHEYKTQNKVEFVSGHQKKELREEAVRRARSRSLPKTTIVETAWNLGDNRLLFFSQSKTMIETFQRLFEQTFNATLQPVSLADEMARVGRKQKFTSLLGDIWPDIVVSLEEEAEPEEEER